MTVLMMGIMEGIYLRNNGLIASSKGWRSETRLILIPMVFLALMVLIGVVWFTGIKPFKGEREYFKYIEAINQRKAKEAEKFILKALDKSWHRHQVQTVRWRLYQIGGKIVFHGGQVFLKVSRRFLSLFNDIRLRVWEFANT